MSTQQVNSFQLIIGSIKLSYLEIVKLDDFSQFDELAIQVIRFIQEWHKEQSYLFQQTSGSTGTPKQIKLNKSQMKASAASTIAALDLKAGDYAFLCIHPDYIGGKMMIVRAIEHKLQLVLGKVAANPLKDISDSLHIDFFSFVPYQFQSILEEQLNSLAQLNQAKAIILGGAAVSVKLQQQIQANISAPCYSTYGMTETVSHVALKRLNGLLYDDSFHAIDGIQFSVNENDCLIIHAPHITGVEHLPTNDVVTLHSPTQFEWLGRYDFIINSGGIKIHAEALEQEIAKLFHQHEIENSFLVFGKKHEKLGEELSLLIEASYPFNELVKILENLPKIKRPKQIYYLDRFVYTANDKLNRKDSVNKILE